MPLASSQAVMKLTKNSKSRASSKPWLTFLNRVKKLIEASKSSHHCGAQSRKVSSTSPCPGNKKRKHTTTAAIKATTGLLLKTEIQPLTARKARSEERRVGKECRKSRSVNE